MLEELSGESPSAAVEAEARAAQAELNTLTSTLESALESDGREETPDVVVESEPWRAHRDRPGPEAERVELQSSDSRLAEATELAKEYERVSAQLLQRRMRIGRPRAERLIEQLAEAGVIEQSEGGRSRRVLVRSERQS
ncbi:MAG: hypothetical protein OXG42_02590 [Chloroflexi bacterium]|nr:hypothetical protein [Chloroflexota bacterium]